MNNIPNNTTDKIEFNFTCYALKLLGQNLYSNPWTAISEIVANGIDAKANKIYILVDLFDKDSARIEVIDDGYGMSYQDLCEKYTIIGRNKRNDNPKDKTVLGRKGVGKLAALYLSDTYFLFTKSEKESSAWHVNVSNAKDDDVPALERYNGESIIQATDTWNSQQSGTAIVLTNVNLHKIGPERLKALPTILSDYYLSDIINCKIHTCIRHSKAQIIDFKLIQKHISFETMYELFDNTSRGYLSKIKDCVYLNKNLELPKEVDVPVPTIKMDSFEGTSGTIEVKNVFGKVITANYLLTGWIGIHGSLNPDVQRRNDPSFDKVQYHPNAIRLYVRGKLAVDDLMTYIKNTQAFANYIEGEISFDILDDDRFEDISTSNREGYKKDDVRVITLLNIVGRIVQKMVSDRAAAGTRINNELKAYWDNKRKEEERKRQAEAEARIKAEQAQKEAESALQVVETEKRIIANERNQAVAEKENVKKRLFVLESNFVGDGEKYKQAVHLSVNYAKEIRGTVCDFENVKLNDRNSIMDKIMEIDRAAAKIEKLPGFVDSATFSLISPKITTDIMKLIKEYVEAKGSKRLEYEFDINGTTLLEIDFPDVLMFVDNAISNSIKAKAKKLRISSAIVNKKLQINFTDDGRGLDKKYKDNPQAIFILGETTTPGGFGIGAFHMKEIAEKLGGSIRAIPNDSKGFTIRVEINE